jgi:hypothetical protein
LEVGGHYPNWRRTLAQLQGLISGGWPNSGPRPLGPTFRRRRAQMIRCTWRLLRAWGWRPGSAGAILEAGLPLGRDVPKTSYGCRDFVARIRDKLGPDSVFNQLIDRFGSL